MDIWYYLSAFLSVFLGFVVIEDARRKQHWENGKSNPMKFLWAGFALYFGVYMNFLNCIASGGFLVLVAFSYLFLGISPLLAFLFYHDQGRIIKTFVGAITSRIFFLPNKKPKVREDFLIKREQLDNDGREAKQLAIKDRENQLIKELENLYFFIDEELFEDAYELLEKMGRTFPHSKQELLNHRKRVMEAESKSLERKVEERLKNAQ